MTFSGKVKIELCSDKFYLKQCCNFAFLYGVFLFCRGYFDDHIKIQTENQDLMMILERLFKNFDISYNTEVFLVRDSLNIYCINIVDDHKKKVDALFKIHNDKTLIHMDLLKKRCDRQAFLRGVFLISGVVLDPDKNYHLEFLTPQYNLAQGLCAVMEGFSINLKVTSRKNSYVVYSKDSDNIIDILNIMGATSNALRFMETKIVKDVRNNINRKVNFETANLSKTAYAAAEQIAAIEKIQKSVGLDSLPDSLKQMALLRLENPDMSLSELGGLVQPVLSRSGVNHRFKKIMEIAGRL